MTKWKFNNDEYCAQVWLRQQGYRDIRRPCDDPPDFVVDGVYAVEVTRLNQRIVIADDGRSVGEEEARKPLTGLVEKIIGQLGPPGNEGCSWVVDCEYDFAKPLPRPRIVTHQVSDALTPLLRPYNDSVIAGMHSKHFNHDKHAGETSHLQFPHLCLDCGICLELAELSHKPAKFILQNVSDGHGISLITELKTSIENRVRDKSASIAGQGRVGEYRDWWLILVDHICQLPMTFLPEDQLALVANQKFNFWSKVVVVSARSPSWHYELYVRPAIPCAVARTH